jgi:hypothetical protein
MTRLMMFFLVLLTIAPGTCLADRESRLLRGMKKATEIARYAEQITGASRDRECDNCTPQPALVRAWTRDPLSNRELSSRPYSHHITTNGADWVEVVITPDTDYNVDMIFLDYGGRPTGRHRPGEVRYNKQRHLKGLTRKIGGLEGAQDLVITIVYRGPGPEASRTRVDMFRIDSNRY